MKNINSVILTLVVSLVIYLNTNTEKTTKSVESKRYIEIVSIAKPVVEEKAKARAAIKKYARVTKYVWTGNPMANGKFPDTNHVAVSDRSIKLGSILWVGYRLYTVGDYTSTRIHDSTLKWGYDLTVDIYTEESLEQVYKYGAKKFKIALLAIK